MATKLGLITVGGKRVIELDSSPVSGYDAPIGSMVMVNESGTGRLYLKIGSASTAWENVQAGAVDLSAYFKKDGSVLATGDFDLNSHKISNLSNGTLSGDAVNKGQLDSGLALKIDLTEKGSANGVATLGADGKIPSSQVPAIAITDTFVVASELAMLSLSTAEQGDVAVRTDLNKSFILVSGSYSVLSNWQELLTPTDTILSVNGQTGVVVLDTDDIAEGVTNKYFTEARVLATQLAGLSLASASAIVDGDSVIVAFGKLQKQISDEVSARSSADTTLQNNIDAEALARASADTTLQNNIDAHINDTVGAHAGSAISFIDNGNFTGITNVQDAIYAIDNYITNHVIQDDGSVPMLANLNLNSNKIVNLASPTASTDASNKSYVDAEGGTQVVNLDGASHDFTTKKISVGTGSDVNTKFVLPLLSTVEVGATYTLVNQTTVSISGGTGGVFNNVGDSAGALLTTVPAGHKGFFTKNASGSWSFHFTLLRLSGPYQMVNRAIAGLLSMNFADATPSYATPKSYVDAQDASNLSSAQSYADAKVEDQIVNGVTTKAPSQNAVFDALALKANISYVDAQDASTLASANSYADGLISALPQSWLSPSSASSLNTASANLYFGTKAGDFDIFFYRNNEEYFKMSKVATKKKMEVKLDAIERSDANFAISVPNNVLTLAGNSLYQEAQLFIKVPIFSGPLPVQITEYEKGENATIADGDATKSITYTSNSSSSNRRIKVKIMLTSDQGDLFMEKDVHINRAGSIVITQDSFTSKDSGVSAVECSMSFSAGVLSANLSGMGSLTTKKVVMKCEEISQNP